MPAWIDEKRHRLTDSPHFATKKAAIKQQPSIVMPRPLFSLLSIFSPLLFSEGEKVLHHRQEWKLKVGTFFFPLSEARMTPPTEKFLLFLHRAFSTLPVSQEKRGRRNRDSFRNLEFRMYWKCYYLLFMNCCSLAKEKYGNFGEFSPLTFFVHVMSRGTVF